MGTFAAAAAASVVAAEQKKRASDFQLAEKRVFGSSK